jgi:hypothetical protein
MAPEGAATYAKIALIRRIYRQEKTVHRQLCEKDAGDAPAGRRIQLWVVI